MRTRNTVKLLWLSLRLKTAVFAKRLHHECLKGPHYVSGGIFPLSVYFGGPLEFRILHFSKTFACGYQEAYLRSYNSKWKFAHWSLCRYLIQIWNCFLKDPVKYMRYFTRSKFSGSLVHKLNFNLIRQGDFKLGYVFLSRELEYLFWVWMNTEVSHKRQ